MGGLHIGRIRWIEQSADTDHHVTRADLLASQNMRARIVDGWRRVLILANGFQRHEALAGIGQRDGDWAGVVDSSVACIIASDVAGSVAPCLDAPLMVFMIISYTTLRHAQPRAAQYAESYSQTCADGRENGYPHSVAINDAGCLDNLATEILSA